MKSCPIPRHQDVNSFTRNKDKPLVVNQSMVVMLIDYWFLATSGSSFVLFLVK